MRPANESPLSRRSYPAGQTSAFVMKALLKHLDANKGRGVAEQWLKSIHVERDDLDDETRPMPLTTLHRALQRFSELTSREAIGEIWDKLIAPDNLGVWMRVLRGTIVPADAFSRLDSSDSEYGRTTRWETIENACRLLARAGPHRPRSGARGGRLSGPGAGRRAGLGAGALRLWPRSGDRARREHRDGERHRAGVRGALVGPDGEAHGPIGAAMGLGLGAIALLTHPSLATGGIALAAGCAGALIGMAVARERLRHAETSAQTSRVHALERSFSSRRTANRRGRSWKGRLSPASTASGVGWARARPA